MVTPNYVPMPPKPGKTIIKIVRVAESENHICLDYDIGIGPAVGYAHYIYQITGTWPLRWIITTKQAGAIVLQHLLSAIQSTAPHANQICDVVGVSLVVHLDYTDDSHAAVRVCRSYPLGHYKVAPDDIRLDKNASWAIGSAEYIRAHLMAANSGLPVILVDHHCEKQSPMVDWCADNGIVLLPSLLPAGDYQLPNGKTLVDRKANLLELYNDFAMPDNRLRYENAAMIASAHNMQLVYVVATDPQDAIADLESLKVWSAPVPGTNIVASGDKLYAHLVRYQWAYPNIAFVFCDQRQVCSTIYHQI